MQRTLVSTLDEAAVDRTDAGGLRFVQPDETGVWMGWRLWADRARKAAGALRAQGVRRGDRVVIVLPTGPAFFDAFLGTLFAGAVPVPLYPPVRLGRMDEYLRATQRMIEVVDAAAVVTEGRVRRVLGRLAEAVRPRAGWIDARALDGAPLADPSAADDLALVQFSSGTTVDPKPVGLTHRQLLANADRLVDVILDANPRDGDVPPAGVSWLPLYHDMGLIGCVLPALLVPGPLTLIPPERFLARPALWLRAIARWRGTVSPAPDFAFGLCVERVRDEELEGLDLSSWSLALDGAEPISPATLRAFTERFAPFGLRPEALTPVYGLSEMALAVTFSETHAPPRTVHLDADALATGLVVDDPDGVERVTVGRAFPGFDVRVVGPDGAPLPDRAVGRVHVRGPSAMQGYLDRDAQPFVDGWLDTGDLGALVDGDLLLTGRAKDVLVLRGRNHAPQDVERALDGVDGLRTGCSAAVADVTSDGERLLVFAEVRERVDGQAEACLRAVSGAIGVRPDLVVLLDPGTLPRTSSGKIRRAETLRRHLAGTLTPPDAVTPWRLAGLLADSTLAHWRARWGGEG